MNHYATPVLAQDSPELHEVDLTELIDIEFLKLIARKDQHFRTLYADPSISIVHSSAGYEVIKTVSGEEYSYGYARRCDELLRLLCLVSPAFAQHHEIVDIRHKFMPTSNVASDMRKVADKIEALGIVDVRCEVHVSDVDASTLEKAMSLGTTVPTRHERNGHSWHRTHCGGVEITAFHADDSNL